jgi:hypothetical protein
VIAEDERWLTLLPILRDCSFEKGARRAPGAALVSIDRGMGIGDGGSRIEIETPSS